MTRIVGVVVAAFVVVIVVLWVRHQRALARRNEQLAAIVATTRADDTKRIAALREAAAKPLPSEAQACPYRARVRIVRLASMETPGGSLHDVVASVAEQREPAPWSHELDVVDGRAFLYEYASHRVLCVGTDAEDPHGTLVAY